MLLGLCLTLRISVSLPCSLPSFIPSLLPSFLSVLPPGALLPEMKLILRPPSISCPRNLKTTTRDLPDRNPQVPGRPAEFPGARKQEKRIHSVGRDVNKRQEAAPFWAAPVSIPQLKPCQRFHDKLVFLDASLRASRACLVVRLDTENAFIIFSPKKGCTL